MWSTVAESVSPGSVESTYGSTIDQSINLVPCSLAQVIMAFHASLSQYLVAFAKLLVTRPTFSYFVSPSNIIFSLFSPVVLSFNHSNCLKIFRFLSCHHITQKKVAWHLRILFLSDLDVSAVILFQFIDSNSNTVSIYW